VASIDNQDQETTPAEAVADREEGAEGQGSGVATAEPPAAAAERSAATSPVIPPTRAGHTWLALAAGMFFLVVVLVFILQNLHSVRVHFFWATWTIPLAVDLLLATVLGGLIMFTAGSLRIVQLRRVAKRNAAAPSRGR
jgi:uncharacterized integral membrane protein